VEDHERELRERAVNIAQQQKQIKALTLGLEKLTARLEVDAHGRNVVLSDR